MRVLLFIVFSMFLTSCATTSGPVTAETMCSKTDADPLRIYRVTSWKTKRKYHARAQCYKQEIFKSLDECPGLANRFCRVNWEEIRKEQTLNDVVRLLGEPDETRGSRLIYSDQGKRLGSVDLKKGKVKSFDIVLSRDLPIFEGPRSSDDKVDIKLIIVDYKEIKSTQTN